MSFTLWESIQVFASQTFKQALSNIAFIVDDRILEYNWTRLLFSERTPYQLVEIYGTKDFGNCLVLDGFMNLAESDLSYTRQLMCHGHYDYADKEVLILGGGDGALLHELLKEKPKFVTMVDIDEAVIRACKEHMRCDLCLAP